MAILRGERGCDFAITLRAEFNRTLGKLTLPIITADELGRCWFDGGVRDGHLRCLFCGMIQCFIHFASGVKLEVLV